MRKLSLIIGAAVLVAACASAGEAVTWVLTVGTNTAATGYSDSFTGEIDEIAVYASTGATGAVAVAAIDPYSGDALVLGTNAAATGTTIFVPRVVGAAAIGGVAARVVTNSATADRFSAQGEKFYATVSGSNTGATYRVRVKVK